jgi:predicted small lipoprotein YifL
MEDSMLRKCLVLAAVVVALGLAACGTGPHEPMPPDDPMAAAADTLTR